LTKSMKYKKFELDTFQIDSIKSIDQNHSVVVSAATGTGKTLIADYIVNEAIKKNKKVIYTSPIKALSNQKYREFHTEYGSKVGLMTGDVVINGDAEILIMTTEIYRNMLLEKRKPFPDLSYVIFDEIHYINDIERGTVWEESIIFSPNHVRFLCLSATIPNYKDFAGWIEKIKQHKVDTVNFMKRAVPLEHQIYDYNLGLSNISELKKDWNNKPYYEFRREDKSRKNKKNKFPLPDYFQLIKSLHSDNATPCIYFTFSRKDAFEKGVEMSRKMDCLENSEKTQIIEFLRKEIPESISKMASVQKMRAMLVKGFGVHHAGILPKMKEIVENLFGMGLIKVLFATETFAVGINMPAKTVVMGSIKKYDGISLRNLSTKEYFQMAGRAGRRGIDSYGRVVVMINRNDLDITDVEKVTLKDVEPIISRFSISYNTVLNLIKSHSKSERDVILKSNFGYYMRKSGNQTRIDQSFINYIRILKKMGYVNEELDEDGHADYKITWKGSFATHIFAHDLVLPELYYSGIMKKLDSYEMVLFLMSLEYEGRLSDKFDDYGVSVSKTLDKISSNNYILKKIKKRNLKKLSKMCKIWMNGGEFSRLLEICNLAEGDIIRLFRRVIDTLKQMKSAIISTEKDEETIVFIKECIAKVDRDMVKVEL